MRIGIDATALPARPGGAGTYILQLVQALTGLLSSGADHAHELVIFAQRSRQPAFDVQPSQGLTWALVPDISPPVRLAWEQTALPLLVRRHQIDLLHSPHYTRPLILPCASVVTFHDMTFFLSPSLHVLSKRTFFPLAIRLSARLADGLIAVSESTRQDAIRVLGISPGKITTTTLGVSERFHPITEQTLLAKVRRKYALPGRFVLYLGAIEPRKNLTLLLEAFSRLVKDGISHDLVVVGQRGWMVDEVFRAVTDLKLDERVHFTGYVPTEDLPILYNLSQVFVYPSQYEGFGIPPVEAMACGIPVVATQSSAMTETVGDAGLLAPLGDEIALAEAIRKLVSDPELRHQLRERGLKRAATFTWEQTARATLKVYERVMLERGT
jgi:glycosyltransferase involved in cell wall biosynthesis